jgi:predicted ATPase
MKNLKFIYETSPDGFEHATWDELFDLAKKGIITPDTQIMWEGGVNGILFRYLDAEFFYSNNGKMYHAYSEDELNIAFAQGNIALNTKIWGKNLPEGGITYTSLRIVNLNFTPTIREFIQLRNSHQVTILSGPNNSGKSLILKLLRKELGTTSTFLPCNRFYHLDQLGQASSSPNQHRQRYANYVTQFYTQKNNMENADFPISEIISQMGNDQRAKLWEIATEMLGERFSMIPIDPENELSPRYIDVNGENLALASSGTRLLLMTVAACLDTNTNVFLIDEPEMGLSPKLQAVLAKFLLTEQVRNKFFPHINTFANYGLLEGCKTG